MSKSLTIVIISGDKIKDNLFHAADIFESFKAFAMPNSYKIDYEGEMTDEKQIKLLKTFKAELEFTERVVAIFVPNSKSGAYLDSTIKSISNGMQWTMLDKVLSAYQFVQ